MLLSNRETTILSRVENVTSSIVILSSVTRMNREMDCGSVRSKIREVIVTRCVNSCRLQFLTVYIFIDVIVDVNSRENK